MPDHFGRHGFKRPQSILKKDKIINVGELEEIFPGKKDIDLTKEGYDKLLGAGSINSSLKIKVKSASQKAIDKIAGKGGEVKTEMKVEVEKPEAEETQIEETASAETEPEETVSEEAEPAEIKAEEEPEQKEEKK